MPVPSPRFTATKILVLTVLATGAFSVFAARRWYDYDPSVAALAAPGIKGERSRAASLPEQKVKVISLKLNRTGFAPSSVTAPKGSYFLTVLNSTELDGLELRISREGGPHVKEGKVSKGKLRWNEQVDLHPGNYVVTEPNHPDWVCRISVTAHDE